MQFVVPQFIEREAKLIGPLTFKQFVFVGTALGVCIFFYFIFSLYTFAILSIFTMGLACSLAFIKIGKTPFPTVIKNFFVYLFSSKVYLWKREIKPYKPFIKPSKEPKIEIGEKPKTNDLKIAQQSKLKELLTRIETKTR